MNTYNVTVKHDNGYFRIKVRAMSSDSARYIVAAAEQCPDHAIVKVTEIKKGRV